MMVAFTVRLFERDFPSHRFEYGDVTRGAAVTPEQAGWIARDAPACRQDGSHRAYRARLELCGVWVLGKDLAHPDDVSCDVPAF